LGGLRSVAQTISYEIVLAFIFLCVIFVIKSLRFIFVLEIQKIFRFVFLFLICFGVFFISCVVETNRAPFDLAEGESELVSGFNVEFGGVKFALIFMAEYARIIWICVLCGMIFFGRCFFVRLSFLVLLFLYLRSSYPRIRYDYLISLTWKKFLPVVLMFYFFILPIV